MPDGSTRTYCAPLSSAAEMGTLLAANIAAAAQLACLLEASAPKPGNVSPGRPFADVRYEDFLASAAAIGGPLAGAGQRPVGETVRLAIEATAASPNCCSPVMPGVAKSARPTMAAARPSARTPRPML